MTFTQVDRPFQVLTPLPFDKLLFYRMTGEEDLGRMFRYELDLLSEDDSIDINQLLGQPIAVRVERRDSERQPRPRYFNGIVKHIFLNQCCVQSFSAGGSESFSVVDLAQN